MNDIEVLRQRQECTLGGSVTDVGHRMTKNGKPFGTLTMEDYDGSHTFFIFGEDYTRFKSFLSPGWFLYLQGSVQPKPWGDGELEFKIKNIQLLNDIRGKMTKSMLLQMPIHAIDEQLIARIEEVGNRHPGSCEMKLRIAAEAQGKPVELELLSRKYRVEPSNEVMKALQELADVEVKLVG